MNFFATIEKETRERGLRYLVIGGHAVIYYGYSRITIDLDFLVCSDDREAWVALFMELGYSIFSDSQTFIQLKSTDPKLWQVDLMMARPPTFEPMFAEGLVADFHGTSARIAKLEHLISLKLHALKNSHTQRFLKDFLDVQHLITINHLDIRSENVRGLFTKYATLDLYEKMRSIIESEG